MKVDLSYLKNMSDGNQQLVLDMIDIFKSQVTEFTTGMDSLYAKKEFENLGRLAHKAKSSISIMGLNDLALELKTFENLVRSGESSETYPEFIAHFKKETSEALKELEEIISNLDQYI